MIDRNPRDLPYGELKRELEEYTLWAKRFQPAWRSYATERQKELEYEMNRRLRKKQKEALA